MNGRAKVKAYLNALGLPSDIGSFLNRITIQKLVYLLREYDQELKFGYYWYIHGPYSTQLTRVLFDEEDSTSPQDLNKFELRAVNEVRNFLTDDLYKVDSLELIVSLIYLMKHGRERDLNTKKDMIEFLQAEKPQFSLDEIERAW